MAQMNDLERLEAVVAKMLSSMNVLKQEKAALQGQVEEKDLIIQELEEKISAISFDQESISSRVTSLISSIEEWEESLEGSNEDNTAGPEAEEEMQDISVDGDVAGKAEAQLFNMSE